MAVLCTLPIGCTSRTPTGEVSPPSSSTQVSALHLVATRIDVTPNSTARTVARTVDDQDGALSELMRQIDASAPEPSPKESSYPGSCGPQSYVSYHLVFSDNDSVVLDASMMPTGCQAIEIGGERYILLPETAESTRKVLGLSDCEFTGQGEAITGQSDCSLPQGWSPTPSP